MKKNQVYGIGCISPHEGTDGGYNIITDNKIFNNNIGICNRFCDGSASSCSNDLIYNNYFNNNIINARDTGTNFWNTTKSSGINIIGGPYIGGNYWGDYNGMDINEDWMGDTEIPYNSDYNINVGGDYLPLIGPPTITVLSPGQDSIYHGDPPNVNVPLNFVVNTFSTTSPSWIGYSLNDEANITISGNVTLNLAEGGYILTIYANNDIGMMGSSDKVYFGVLTHETGGSCGGRGPMWYPLPIMVLC